MAVVAISMKNKGQTKRLPRLIKAKKARNNHSADLKKYPNPTKSRAQTPLITLYSMQSCPFCILAIRFLKKHNLKFKKIDVEHDIPAAMDMIKRSGQQGVPVFEIGGKMVCGYDEKQLRLALKI
jgi:glutaredoxin 3